MRAWFAVLALGIFVAGLRAGQDLTVLMPEESAAEPAWWRVAVAATVAATASGLAWYAARDKESEEK